MNKLTIERTFTAPIQLVWQAFTEADLLEQWWSPEGIEAAHVSVNLQPGGEFRYCHRDPSGKSFWGRGVYQTIQQPTLVSLLDTFVDEHGTPVAPSYYGMPGEDIIEALVEFHLSEENGVTTMKLVSDNPHGDEMTKEMSVGWNSMFDKLEALLARA